MFRVITFLLCYNLIQFNSILTDMTVFPLLINFGFWEILIVLLVVLLLFGGKKIPELMKGIGQGISNFKKGIKEDSDDINQ